MLRKLVLSGLITLLAPGTVIQSVATVCFSLVFIVLHAVMCEYPNAYRLSRSLHPSVVHATGGSSSLPVPQGHIHT